MEFAINGQGELFAGVDAHDEEETVKLVSVKTVCPRCGREGRPVAVDKAMATKKIRKFCYACDSFAVNASVFL